MLFTVYEAIVHKLKWNSLFKEEKKTFHLGHFQNVRMCSHKQREAEK